MYNLSSLSDCSSVCKARGQGLCVSRHNDGCCSWYSENRTCLSRCDPPFVKDDGYICRGMLLLLVLVINLATANS